MKGKNCFALMIALLVMLPPANAGTKEELIRLQTDVNTLRDQIRELERSFSEQISGLKSLTLRLSQSTSQ